MLPRSWLKSITSFETSLKERYGEGSFWRLTTILVGTDLSCIPEIVVGRTFNNRYFCQVCTLGLISFVAKTIVFWSLSRLLLSCLEVIFDHVLLNFELESMI